MLDRTLYTFAFVSILLSGCVKAGQAEWSKTDTALQSVFLAELAVDYYQTAQPGGIVDQCREWNPLIGECGDAGGATGTLLVVAVAHTAIATSLKPKWRRIFQSVSIGVEYHQVWANYQAGFGIMGMWKAK